MCHVTLLHVHREQVEAEEVEDLAERYDVSAVPHFLILKVRVPGMLLCMYTACILLHQTFCAGQSIRLQLPYMMLYMINADWQHDFVTGWQSDSSSRGR
jgi:hypothetical protein